MLYKLSKIEVSFQNKHFCYFLASSVSYFTKFNEYMVVEIDMA